jgi:hypothetical protein
MWTLARFHSRDDIVSVGEHFIWTITTGAVIGALMSDTRGLLIGAGVGLAAGAFFLIFDGLLWLVFTLPPHPKIDF